MKLFQASILMSSLIFLSDCTKSSPSEEGSVEVAEAESVESVDTPATLGEKGDSSLEAEVIFTEPEEKELTQSLNSSSTFNLTVGPSEESNVSMESQPENAKVVYFDVQTLIGENPLGETETSLEGEAELQLQLGQHYVVQVEFKNQGLMKALIGPDLISVDNEGVSVLDLRLSRTSTIAADIFMELIEEKDVLPLIYSLDVKTSTIYDAANALLKEIKEKISEQAMESYWKSEMYQESLDLFAAQLAKEVLTITPYSTEFANKKIEEIVAGLEIQVPKVKIDFEVKPNIATTCYIRQSTCEKHPTKIGEFKDNYQNSANDYVRCLQRASEYHRWCGNSGDDVTFAEFRQNDNILISSDSQTPFEGCFITMDSCGKYPDRSGQFIDTYKDASNDADRCMMRAHDFFKSCKNTGEFPVTATYYEKGIAIQHLDSNSPYSGCFVQISSCEAKPEWVGLKYDNYQSSSTDVNRCMQRAHDYQKSCKNPNSVKTVATFYNKGEIVKEIDSQTPFSGCFIKLNSCESHPENIGIYIDNYQQASSDKERCLSRAHEIHRWCGNAFNSPVESLFYQNGQNLASSSSQQPYDGCFISQKTCVKTPERVGLFYDNYQNSSGDPERCMMRAHDYHRSCGNVYSEVVTATFYRKGVASETLDSQTPYEGCFVKIDKCDLHPEKEGLFIDNSKNASYEPDRCMMRAADFHGWCKNKFDNAVVASFYEKGEVKNTVDSKTPYAGCYINQDKCVKNASKVGLFKDNTDNSSFDKDRCLLRAKELHVSCKNTAATVTTASFYESGDMLDQATYNK